MSGWTADQIPDQSGRTILVTGANSGLGLVTARELARAGATVVLTARDRSKCDSAVADIRQSVPDALLDPRLLDLASLDSVRRLATGVAADHERIDVLVNNGGIMAPPRSTTRDGFELQFATNHLGPFALTNLLLPMITDRVVTVASGVHRMARIELGDLNWQTRPYNSWRAYAQSKLANLLFTLELQRRLELDGSPVKALAAHPGWAATNLQGRTRNRLGNRLVLLANKILAQSDEMGALPTLFAASQDLPGASYVGPDGRGEQRGHPTLVGRSAAASDVELAQRLWQASEALTGISYPTGAGRGPS
jgi:NAD(P)-dependent dehydrogenase (short-subunit alcohol dehydrogenase family)